MRDRRLFFAGKLLRKAVLCPDPPRIPRVRFGRHRAAVGRGALFRPQKKGRRRLHRRGTAARGNWHRPHPLGHARRPVRWQRPSAPLRQVCPRAQRHRGKRGRPARGTIGRGRAIPLRNGQRTDRPPDRARVPGRFFCGGCVGVRAFGRQLCRRSPLRRFPRGDRLRPPRQCAGCGSGRRRPVRVQRCPRPVRRGRVHLSGGGRRICRHPRG